MGNKHCSLCINGFANHTCICGEAECPAGRTEPAELKFNTELLGKMTGNAQCTEEPSKPVELKLTAEPLIATGKAKYPENHLNQSIVSSIKLKFLENY